jgi:DNA-binding transcriptional ArsR family regulator
MSDSAFKALADPTRREILRLLSSKDLAAGELGDHFSISQPAVSRHLAVLRSAGLVTARRDGQSVVYALDTTVVQDVVRLLLDLSDSRRAKGAKK